MTGFSRHLFVGFSRRLGKAWCQILEENSTMNPMDPIRWEIPHGSPFVLSLEEAEKIRFFLSGIHLRSITVF